MAAPHSEFRRGVLLGLALAGMLLWLMAAGRQPQHGAMVIDAIMASGVEIDPRIAALPISLRRSLLCVATNVLMEARGEPDAGQLAVAWVTRTRSEERDLSPCDVTFERSQFSWTAYPPARIVRTAAANGEALLEAQSYAWDALVEGVPDPTQGANHFYAHAVVRPAWAALALPGSRKRIGGHTFLRIVPRGAPRPPAAARR
jgi:N-acetylmuramoyl-L-alanine amidase